MQLGYLTPYSPDAVRRASAMGFDCVELDCGWFSADGRGISSLEQRREEARDLAQESGIFFSALGMYGNPLLAEQESALSVFERAFDLVRYLGCEVLAAMAGRDPSKSIDENMPLLQSRWSLLAKAAEDRGVRIAFEPWPGSITGHGPYEWYNSASTPEIWQRLFDAVPSRALGLEYDPSHLLWQQIDYVLAIREFGDRIYHVHAKDTKIDRDRLARCGVHGDGWWRFTVPGDGEVDWKSVLDALRDAGYDGPVVIEHEDERYCGDRFAEGLARGRDYLRALL